MGSRIKMMGIAVGLLLLLAGVGLSAWLRFSETAVEKRGSIWILAPSYGASDYSLDGLTLQFTISDERNAVMELEMRLTVNNASRTYELGIMQPFQISDSNVKYEGTSASKPSTAPTLLDEYFTKTQFTPQHTGSQSISITAKVVDFVTGRELGKRSTILSFWGVSGYDPTVIGNPGMIPALASALVLSIRYPETWSYAANEMNSTIPIEQSYAGEFKTIVWRIDRTSVDFASFFGFEVNVTWTVAQEVEERNWAVAASPILVMAGTFISICSFILVVYRSRGE